MKKILFLVLEYFIIKIVLALFYVISFNKEIIFNNYICRNNNDIHNITEYSCNLFEYSFNSTFWTLWDWISVLFIILTIIVYWIYIVYKRYK